MDDKPYINNNEKDNLPATPIGENILIPKNLINERNFDFDVEDKKISLITGMTGEKDIIVIFYYDPDENLFISKVDYSILCNKSDYFKYSQNLEKSYDEIISCFEHKEAELYFDQEQNLNIIFKFYHGHKESKIEIQLFKKRM